MTRAVLLAWILAVALLPACARQGRAAVRPARGIAFSRELRAQVGSDLGCLTVTLTEVQPGVALASGCGVPVLYFNATGVGSGWYRVPSVDHRAASELACSSSRVRITSPGDTVRAAHGCGRVARYDLVCRPMCEWEMTAHGGVWDRGPTMPAALPAASARWGVPGGPMTTDARAYDPSAPWTPPDTPPDPSP